MKPTFTAIFPSTTNTAQVTPDVLGLWHCSSGEPLSHASTQPRSILKESAGVVWRANLPGDRLEAQYLLNIQSARFAITRHALPAAGRMLQNDLRLVNHVQEGEIFAIPTTWPAQINATSLDTPQAVLALAFGQRYPGQVTYETEGSDQINPKMLEEASRTVADFFAQVLRIAGQFALIESKLGGCSLGSTRVTWLGDPNTWWSSRADPEDYPFHLQVVAQVLATRQAWTSFLLLFSAGVVQVAAALAAGPFSLLSIWATWNYLKQVVRRYQELQVNIKG